jgi:peptide/nickel transport system permease protein
VTRFVIRRIIQSLLLLIGITFITFWLQQLAPGGPQTFNEDPRLPPQYAAEQRREFGLDQPVYVQYGKWLWQLGHGNFGRSFADRRPVWDKIMDRAPNTMLLSGSGLLLGFLGIPLGVLAALRRGGVVDNLLRVVTALGNAIPHWWLGLVILLISVKTVNWFPTGGMYKPGDASLWDRLHHLMLPASITALGYWLTFSRFMRSEFLEVISQDYIRTARAKGLPERRVLVSHAFRNALIVIVTILGGSLAALISGAVLFENVFSWPGMGRLGIEAASQRDYPLLMGLIVITSALVILGNFLADIAYVFIDPRIKYS